MSILHDRDGNPIPVYSIPDDPDSRMCRFNHLLIEVEGAAIQEMYGGRPLGGEDAECKRKRFRDWFREQLTHCPQRYITVALWAGDGRGEGRWFPTTTEARNYENGAYGRGADMVFTMPVRDVGPVIGWVWRRKPETMPWLFRQEWLWGKRGWLFREGSKRPEYITDERFDYAPVYGPVEG